MDKIVKIEEIVDKEKVIYRASAYTYSFQNFQTIKTFGKDIYSGKITLKQANEYQTNLLVEIMNFREKAKPQDPEKKTRKKNMSLKTCVTFLRAEKNSLMLMLLKYFPQRLKALVI